VYLQFWGYWYLFDCPLKGRVLIDSVFFLFCAHILYLVITVEKLHILHNVLQFTHLH